MPVRMKLVLSTDFLHPHSRKNVVGVSAGELSFAVEVAVDL